MKRMTKLLNEVKGEKAHREAIAKGLKYRGFGYWEDGTGEVKFKTQDDKLVPVDPEIQSELGGGKDETAEKAFPGGGDEKLGDLGTTAQMQQAMGMQPGTGENVGPAPEPGEEQVPSTLEWEPGPDGSTCVDSNEPPGKIPEDSYVSTTNNLKWGAGPDGSNYSNVEYAQLLKDLRSPNLDSFLQRQENFQRYQDILNEDAAVEAQEQGLTSAGYGYWQDATGKVVAQTKNGKLVYVDQTANPQSNMTAATTNTGNPTSPASGQTPADQAAAMGLQSNGSGGYVDDSGQVVAKTVNGELVFYDDAAGGGAISAGSGGAQLSQSAPSWVDPVTGQLVVPPAQAESPEEINAIPDPTPAVAPAGYDAFMQKRKKEMYAAQTAERDMEPEVPQMAMEAVRSPEERAAKRAEIADRKSSLVASGDMVPQPQGKKFPPEAARQIVKGGVQQKTDLANLNPNKPSPAQPSSVEKQAQARGLATNRQEVARQDAEQQVPKAQAPTPAQDLDGDGEIDLEELRSAAGNAYKSWTGKKTTVEDRMAKRYEPMMEALNREGVDPKLRGRILNTMLNAYRYEGRDNEASSNFNKAEFKALQERKDRLMKAYGGEGSDGSAHNLDSIREYQKEINDMKLDDDVVGASFDALPPSLQKLFSGGDMNARQGFEKYLTQHAKDGYTGLPLDMRTMQMEHFIDDTQARNIEARVKKGGEPMTPEEAELVEFIRGPENQFWSRQAPNEQKSSRNLKQFYDERITPFESLGDDFFDYREMTVDPARMKLKGKEKEFVGGLINSDDPDNPYLSEMTSDQYNAHREAVNQMYANEKKDLTDGLSQSFDSGGFMKMGPKKFEDAINDPNSEVSEADRAKYDMLRNLKGKIAGYNPSFSKRLMESLGMPTHTIQSERARSSSLSPDFYDAVASQLPGKTKEQQKEIIEKVKAATKAASGAANRGRGKGNKDADIRKMMYNSLFQEMGNNEMFNDDTFAQFPGLAKLRDANMIMEGMEGNIPEMTKMEKGQEFDLEDIMDVVKELLYMSKYNDEPNPRGMNFEEFRRYNR